MLAGNVITNKVGAEIVVKQLISDVIVAVALTAGGSLLLKNGLRSWWKLIAPDLERMHADEYLYC